MSGEAAGLAQRLGPFRHRGYAAYWFGVATTSIGTWIQAVAGSIFIYQLTSSSFMVGVFNFAAFVPILLFSVWGGQISDRYDRRLVVQLTHVLSIVIAGLFAVLAIAGVADAVVLIITMFLLNVLWALGKPALLSLVPNIVPREDLQDAVALSSLAFMVGQIAGPIIAAIVIALSGVGLAFAINALTYGGPVVAMLYLGRAMGSRPAREGGGEGEPAAVSAPTFVRRNVWVAALLAGVVVAAMAIEIQRTVAPQLVSEKLRLPLSDAGLLVAAQSTGSAVTLLLFVQIRKLGWSRRAAYAGFVAQAAGVVIAAAAVVLPLSLLGFALIGMGYSLLVPTLTAELQAATPDRLRGRIMAFHQMALLGHRPISALIVGGAVALLGLQGGILVWLVLIPVGLLAVRVAWQRLPPEPGPRRGGPRPVEAAAEVAGSALAER